MLEWSEVGCRGLMSVTAGKRAEAAEGSRKRKNGKREEERTEKEEPERTDSKGKRLKHAQMCYW